MLLHRCFCDVNDLDIWCHNDEFAECTKDIPNHSLINNTIERYGLFVMCTSQNQYQNENNPLCLRHFASGVNTYRF